MTGKARLEKILTSNSAVAKELVLKLLSASTGKHTNLSIPSEEGKVVSMTVTPLFMFINNIS